VQGSGYNTCTGKYCIICPGGTKKEDISIELRRGKMMTADKEDITMELRRGKMMTVDKEDISMELRRGKMMTVDKEDGTKKRIDEECV
jgi:hypothetical protein